MTRDVDMFSVITPAVRFFLFYVGVSFLKLNMRTKGALSLVIKGLLGNPMLVEEAAN